MFELGGPGKGKMTINEFYKGNYHECQLSAGFL